MKKTETSWANGFDTITLFVEDIERTKKFYTEIFALDTFFEDKDSVVFKTRSMLVNFLKVTAADEFIAPAKVGTGKSGSRMVLTIHVENVDAKCRELKEQGVDFLLEPTDRPWGIRTANLMDPDGHIWEIATPIDN